MSELSQLRLTDVTISIGAHALISSFDLAITPGERVTVMGPSGCGKSTLLAFIAGTIDPVFTASGRVAIDGVDVTGLAPERRRVGILFQDDLLFPHLSVGDNLAFALPPALRARRRSPRPS
jgi:putative thiamine transport system ATP-binding protein